MSFDRPPDAYEAFMGVWAEPLADRFLEVVPPVPGRRALDVGCGTGILTRRFVERLGPGAVSALDPSARFVDAARDRVPGADVRQGVAEALPWDDDVFEVAAAQLVVHFMADPVSGLAEMLRVTRPGGRVGACVWDHAGSGTPLAAFWRAAHRVDPDAQDESDLPGSSDGDLRRLLEQAGADDVDSGSIAVQVAFGSFDAWWEPYTYGIGPAGDYVAGLEVPRRQAIAAACRDDLGDGPFTLEATAWWATGSAQAHGGR